MNFENEKIGKLLLKFSVPCVISMLVNALYNIVDQIFIGQGVGYLGNAATTVIYPLIVIATALCLMIGDGVASFFSLKIGTKDYQSAKKAIGTAIFHLFAVAILFFVLANAFFSQLLSLFSVTDAVRPYATDYGRIILIGLPFSMVATGMASLIRVDGSPKYSMFCVLSGAVLNVILDPIAIFVLGMGVKGAAYATIIGQIVSFVVSMLYLPKMRTVRLSLSDIRPNRNIIKILGYGISSLVTQMTVVIMSTVMNNYLTKHGATSVYGTDIPLSIFGIVTKINQIFISIVIGISVGAQPILGYFYGAKNNEKVKETLRITLVACLGFAVVVSAALLLFPQQILNIFGQENDLYNELGVRFFRIFLMLTSINGFTVATGIFFQSLGKPLPSAVCSLSRQLVLFIPILHILSSLYGFEGILWSAPIADLLAFIIALLLFARLYRKELGEISLRRGIEA